MLLATLLALYTFGQSCGFDRARLLRFAEESLPPIAGVLLVVGAGGGFGRVLDVAGVDTAIAQAMSGLQLSPLVLGVGDRVAAASLGRARRRSPCVTAASIMAPIATAMARVNKELLVVAIGAGSLIASHVNDGGFWLVKEYLNMTVPQTVATWTVLETIIASRAWRACCCSAWWWADRADCRRAPRSLDERARVEPRSDAADRRDPRARADAGPTSRIAAAARCRFRRCAAAASGCASRR